MSTPSSSQLPPGAVDITTLPASTLSTLQSRLTSEFNHLSTSHTRLRAVQQHFRECIVAIKTGVQNPTGKATGGKEEKEILVPLTTSLYVPGRLCTGGGGDGGGKEGGKEKEGSGKAMVIVDIGTGYYVEKTTSDAITFYTTKIDDLAKNLGDLEKVIQGKSENVRVVEDVLRQKVMAGEMSGGGVGTASGSGSGAG